MRDDGLVSVLMLSLLALAALLCLAVADAANVLIARARAQTAADAAALAAAGVQWRVAGTGDPSAAAQAIAESNGARLDACACDVRDETAVVTVSVATHIRMLGVAPGRVTATATAHVDIGALFAPP